MSAQVLIQQSAAKPTRRRAIAGLLATTGALLTGCSQNSQYLTTGSTPQSPQTPQAATIGAGQVKAGLILPLSKARSRRSMRAPRSFSGRYSHSR